MGKKSKRGGKRKVRSSAPEVTTAPSYDDDHHSIGTAESFDSVADIPKSMSEEERRKYVEAIVAQAVVNRDARPTTEVETTLACTYSFDPATFWKMSLRALLLQYDQKSQ